MEKSLIQALKQKMENLWIKPEYRLNIRGCFI